MTKIQKMIRLIFICIFLLFIQIKFLAQKNGIKDNPESLRNKFDSVFKEFKNDSLKSLDIQNEDVV